MTVEVEQQNDAPEIISGKFIANITMYEDQIVHTPVLSTIFNDPDNDADGVADDVDKCPLGPEDKDGFEDEDGCEDKDNDRDGVLDDKDQCPMLPESVNEINDDDGCPDFVRLTETQIELLSSVSFEKNKAEILEASHPMLKEIAGLLKLKQEIILRIEGHTDNRGGKKQNLKRSQSRAESVKAFLVAEGIEEKRLRALGIGQERPIEDNKTKAGREKNNRIELHIVGQPQGESKETALWAYGLVVEVYGRRDGRDVGIKLWNRHPSMEEWGGKAAYYKNIAIPLSIGAQMIGRGDVEVKGVVPPETAIDPDIFFAELRKRSIEIHEQVEEYHVVA